LEGVEQPPINYQEFYPTFKIDWSKGMLDEKNVRPDLRKVYRCKDLDFTQHGVKKQSIRKDEASIRVHNNHIDFLIKQNNREAFWKLLAKHDSQKRETTFLHMKSPRQWKHQLHYDPTSKN